MDTRDSKVHRSYSLLLPTRAWCTLDGTYDVCEVVEWLDYESRRPITKEPARDPPSPLAYDAVSGRPIPTVNDDSNSNSNDWIVIEDASHGAEATASARPSLSPSEKKRICAPIKPEDARPVHDTTAALYGNPRPSKVQLVVEFVEFTAFIASTAVVSTILQRGADLCLPMWYLIALNLIIYFIIASITIGYCESLGLDESEYMKPLVRHIAPLIAGIGMAVMAGSCGGSI